MKKRTKLILILLAACLAAAAKLGGTSPSMAATTEANYLVRGGKPRAAIVISESASPFYRFLADELNKYVSAISGAQLEIRSSAQIGSGPELLVLIGGPQVNILVKESEEKRIVRFNELKTDGFYLWTAKLRGRNCIIVGGNDEASTMYAVYDLLERLGITFMLGKDLLPEKTADLRLPALKVKAETPFPRRGLLISNIYPNRGIMHLSEVKTFLDQMAKLKMNYLQFFWFEHEPWINFDFRGEGKLLGDATGKETGYLTWRYNYGSYLIKDLKVGQNLFDGRQRMAPAEFQNVETPEQAFQVARNFLTEIIRYAKTRKIKVWLCVDPTTLPGNLARFSNRAANLSVPFHPILGTHMCPADPELHEMNESRLKALVNTYPEAEGYFLYIPEMFPDCPDERNRSFQISERNKYEGLTKLWRPYTGYERDPTVVMDSTAASLHIVKKMLEARDRIAPNAKVGIGGIGRAFMLPLMDKMFPSNVAFTDMESRAIWTAQGVPMEYFGGMGQRERTLVPRLDDDNAMFGMQFNVNLYYKDRVLEGSLENGVAGFAGQLNRIRGTESNYRYLAEGAWNPKLKPEEFYEEYARKVFGDAAQKPMVAAFKALEENEEYLGWVGQGNFNCCGVLPEISLAYRYYKQPNPYDGPANWKKFSSESYDKIRYYSHSVELLQTAVQLLQSAAENCSPKGKEELKYLLNKTGSYSMHLQTLITVRSAYIAYEEAFFKRNAIPREGFLQKLDKSMALFTQARESGRRTTEKFAEFIDHPSDLGVLYRANLFLVTGLELVEQTMQNMVNFHHGRNYVQPVAWNQIYVEFPQFSPAW